MKYGLDVVQESIGSEMKFKTFSFYKEVTEEKKFMRKDDRYYR